MLERFTWFWQSGYRWTADGLTVYIDPKNVPEDYEPGDVIFITHAHFDHYSPEDLERLRKDDTVVVAPRDVANELSGEVIAVGPGDSVDVRGLKAQALPAYNVVEHRLQSHPQENGWVGYLISLGDVSVYHAGDTDRLPELESVSAQLSFLPVGGGDFTMDAGEAAALAKAQSPDIAVPMHYGFVEGCDPPGAAERFRDAASPVRVEILQPRQPFELT
ncbi:MAG TPA: MBL fold metallo-hydrolase [Actinomycetota bacterium]|nr:MBL fold metallo-hydrolase [Actinomycetota bacterium]